MGYENLTVSGSLRVNYEKILCSYELFMAKNGQLDVSIWESGRVVHVLVPKIVQCKKVENKFSVLHRNSYLSPIYIISTYFLLSMGRMT